MTAKAKSKLQEVLAEELDRITKILTGPVDTAWIGAMLELSKYRLFLADSIDNDSIVTRCPKKGK